MVRLTDDDTEKDVTVSWRLPALPQGRLGTAMQHVFSQDQAIKKIWDGHGVNDSNVARLLTYKEVLYDNGIWKLISRDFPGYEYFFFDGIPYWWLNHCESKGLRKLDSNSQLDDPLGIVSAVKLWNDEVERITSEENYVLFQGYGRVKLKPDSKPESAIFVWEDNVLMLLTSGAWGDYKPAWIKEEDLWDSLSWHVAEQMLSTCSDDGLLRGINENTLYNIKWRFLVNVIEKLPHNFWEMSQEFIHNWLTANLQYLKRR